MRSSTNFVRSKMNTDLNGHLLMSAANSLGVSNEESNFHDALYDCKITKNCVLRSEEGIF